MNFFRTLKAFIKFFDFSWSQGIVSTLTKDYNYNYALKNNTWSCLEKSCGSDKGFKYHKRGGYHWLQD